MYYITLFIILDHIVSYYYYQEDKHTNTRAEPRLSNIILGISPPFSDSLTWGRRGEGEDEVVIPDITFPSFFLFELLSFPSGGGGGVGAAVFIL